MDHTKRPNLSEQTIWKADRFTRVFLAGLAFDFCVRYSAGDAHREGLALVVVEDACRGIDVDGSMATTRESLPVDDQDWTEKHPAPAPKKGIMRRDRHARLVLLRRRTDLNQG